MCIRDRGSAICATCFCALWSAQIIEGRSGVPFRSCLLYTSYLNDSTRNGEWVRSTGMELKGKTIGIMGLGAIGKVTARCAKGFEMNVIAYDPFINEAYCAEHDIGIRAFDELVQQADVIALHLPLMDSTRPVSYTHLFSATVKSGASLNS